MLPMLFFKEVDMRRNIFFLGAITYMQTIQ